MRVNFDKSKPKYSKGMVVWQVEAEVPTDAKNCRVYADIKGYKSGDSDPSDAAFDLANLSAFGLPSAGDVVKFLQGKQVGSVEVYGPPDAWGYVYYQIDGGKAAMVGDQYHDWKFDNYDIHREEYLKTVANGKKVTLTVYEANMNATVSSRDIFIECT